MQPRLEFYPDIETKYEHLIAHMSDKNKVTEDLVKILEEICNFEFFYSKTLDGFANSISKLLLGKDPLKDILIVLERIVASKSEESEKLAKEIKEDLIPHLRLSINAKAQQALRDKQPNVRSIRTEMQRKLRMLFSNENNFKRAISQLSSLPKVMSIGDRLKAMQNFRKKEDQFSDTIDSYNSSIDEYMLQYSEICQELSEMETSRKTQFRDSVSKLVIFEINYIKNLEYNYSRYMDSLNKMEGKLLIQDKVLGGVEPFYAKDATGTIHLAKISNKNYIDNLMGKKRVTEGVFAEQMKITELRNSQEPGQVTQEVYSSLIKTLFPIMDFIHRNNHTNLLIEAVIFCRQIYVVRGNLKITLLNSLLCHELFGDEAFWLAYEQRLRDKIAREQNTSGGDQRSLQKNCSNVLDRDILMLKTIEVNPFITRTVRSVADQYGGVLESRINDPAPPLLRLVTEQPSSAASNPPQGPRIKYQIAD